MRRVRSSSCPAFPQTRRSSSVAQQRADSLDRCEILAVTDRPDRTAVRKRLMHREIETGVYAFEPRAVERAVAALERRAAARRTPVSLVIRALLEEQQFDPPVGSGFQRRAPAGGSAPVAPRLLAPAVDRVGL